MKNKILITGGAGFIAYHLTESLLKSGFDVISIDNFDPYYSVTLKQKNISDLIHISSQLKNGAVFTFIKMDFLDTEALNKLPSDITGIIHLGAKAGVRPSLEDPAGYVRANIEGTTQILNWAAARNIKNFIFGSSSSVYGEDTKPPFSEESLCLSQVSPYAATKRACELMCSTYRHLYKMKIVSLRFFTVYGPRQRPDLVIRKFIEKMSRGEKITMYGDGTTARDYTYVTDIVAGLCAAYNYTLHQTKDCYEIFNLGGHKTTSLLDLIQTLEELLHTKAQLIREPLQPGDVPLTYANIEKAKNALGYQPQTSIQQGLKSTVEWYKQL